MIKWIFSLEKRNDAYSERKKGDSMLIIGYSEKRAKKDKYNRKTIKSSL